MIMIFNTVVANNAENIFTYFDHGSFFLITAYSGVLPFLNWIVLFVIVVEYFELLACFPY